MSCGRVTLNLSIQPGTGSRTNKDHVLFTIHRPQCGQLWTLKTLCLWKQLTVCFVHYAEWHSIDAASIQFSNLAKEFILFRPWPCTEFWFCSQTCSIKHVVLHTKHCLCDRERMDKQQRETFLSESLDISSHVSILKVLGGPMVLSTSGM